MVTYNTSNLDTTSKLDIMSTKVTIERSTTVDTPSTYPPRYVSSYVMRDDELAVLKTLIDETFVNVNGEQRELQKIVAQYSLSILPYGPSSLKLKPLICKKGCNSAISPITSCFVADQELFDWVTCLSKFRDERLNASEFVEFNHYITNSGKVNHHVTTADTNGKNYLMFKPDCDDEGRTRCSDVVKDLNVEYKRTVKLCLKYVYHFIPQI